MCTSIPSMFALILALVNVASAQTTTTTSASALELEPTGTASIVLFPPVLEEPQVQVIGTGSDGTTYRVLGTLLENPFTGTLVQDASSLSEIAHIETQGITVTFEASCSISDSSAECVQNIIGEGATTGTSVTLPQALTAVPILSGTDEPTLTGESTSESASGSVLPPSISPTGPSTGTGTATVVTDAPSETTDSDSAAERLSGVAWALVLPIFVSCLVG